MAGITILRNRTNVYAFCTFSYRDKNKNPRCIRKIVAIVEPEQNKLIFNSFGMAILETQGISLESLNGKYVKEIGKIVDFSITPNEQSFRPREINFSNFIIVNDDLSSKYSYIKDIKKSLVDPTTTKEQQNIDIRRSNAIIDLTNLTNNTETDVFFSKYNYINLPEHQNFEVVKINSDYQIKSYGLQSLLEKIAIEVGVGSILSQIFPSNWKEILTVSFYLLSEDNILQYCENWLENTDSLIPSYKLTSQRISELLYSITDADRINFYKLWSCYRQELEYLAFDVTSVSSYSKLISDVQPGYNRDHEPLPQINICLLFGEESGLPVYLTSYDGSVNDVSAFRTIVDQISFINAIKKYKFVLDKGFYSRKNINKMLENKSRFTISVPHKENLIIEYINKYSSIFNPNHLVNIGNDSLYITSLNHKWDYDTDLTLHICYDEWRNTEAKKDILATMAMLRKEAENNPKTYKSTWDHKKFLNFIHKNDDSGLFDISFKVENINDLYKKKGWFFILTNDDINAVTAINIYRNKDVVEKAFDRYKNNLGFKRLRTHNDATTENKIFIAFISLILLSHVHKIMTKHDLYKYYTMQGLFNKLENMRFITLGNKILTKPVTKAEKDIFNAFGVKIEY